MKRGGVVIKICQKGISLVHDKENEQNMKKSARKRKTEIGGGCGGVGESDKHKSKCTCKKITGENQLRNAYRRTDYNEIQ